MKNIYNLAKSGFDVKFDLGNTFYNYVETIGTGAYGIVCHAKSIHDSNDYAIKKIKNPCMNKVTLIRTLREIKILSHFNHPNIINIVDIFLQNTSNVQDIYVVFILMESDLHKIISSNQNLSDDHIRYFMYQILCGVNYIHSASVIHRDLKPANILINSNCLVKITDFGMARLCANSIRQNSKLTKSNLNFNMTQYVMTRWYRAPELLMGQMHYSSKIDLWSCGCIISELYLKKAIFRGDNMILQLKDIIHKIGVPNQLFRSKVLPIVNSLIDSEGEISSPSISQLIPSAPKKVTDLLSHLLVYDPDERWSAKQSLRHIFFVKYRSPTKESTCESNLNLSFEEEETTVESLRMTLMKEISLISLNSNTFQSDHSSPVTTMTSHNELTHSATNSLYKLKEDLSAQSRLSDRTLSADYGSVFNFPLDCYSGLSKSSDKDKNADAHLKTSTISQSTRAKLINSLKQPKDKIQKRVTAVQRQRERKERRSRLKKKRNECINERLVSTKESPQQLSELDTFSLKRWEYLSNSKVTQVNINNREYNQDSDIKTPSKLEITPKSGDIDEMSAGLLSSLSIFDDLDGVVTSNIDEDSVDCNESTNLDEFINMLDIDSIDLDMNLLESYSSDLFNDSRSNSGN